MEFNENTPFVVFRRRPDMPADQWPSELDGLWWNQRGFPPGRLFDDERGKATGTVVPGRFEVREDGVAARVCEVAW